LKLKTEELQAKNNLKKEAEKAARKEAGERAKKIVPFKGAQILIRILMPLILYLFVLIVVFSSELRMKILS